MIKISEIRKAVLILIVCYTGYFIYNIFKYSYSTNWKECKRYFWIFDPSIIKDIDPNMCYSFVNKNDVYNNYRYKNNLYNIIVWEFKELHDPNLNNFEFIKNADINKVSFFSSETLNSKSDLEITVNFGFHFRRFFSINLDNMSTIDSSFSGNNFKGFYGIINKMSLSDENHKNQVVLNYTVKPTKTILLLLKRRGRFFLILINSDTALEQNLINIINFR